MSSIVVVGTQWGDEGKGKITDFLAEQADVIARFQVVITQVIPIWWRNIQITFSTIRYFL